VGVTDDNVIDDPNLAGIEESMQKDGDLNAADLQARINLKREAKYQDEGITVPPGLAEGVEPLEPEEETGGEVPDDGLAPEPEEPEAPEEPEEPEALTEEELAEAEAEAEDFYIETPASKYRTKEAAEEAYAEKDRTIDRLFSELAQRDQQQPQEAEQGPAQLDVPAWDQWAEQAVAEGQGVQGAMEALRTGGAQGYDIYLAHWLSDPDQVPRAQAFNNEVQRQFAAQQAMRAVSPLLQRDQERSVEQEAEIAKGIAAEDKEDFAELEAEMDRLVKEDGLLPAQTKQRLALMAQQGGVEGKVHAWEYLYMAASATKGKSRAKAQRVEDSRRRAAADRARVQATVSTSEGAQTRTPRTASEDYVISRKNAIRQKLGQPLIEDE
jgi:hypothetical protein